MDAAQKETLRNLLKAYTSKMRSEVAEGRWKLIDDAGFDKVTFGWSGLISLASDITIAFKVQPSWLSLSTCKPMLLAIQPTTSTACGAT